MNNQNSTTGRPVALVILDGWGYAPRTESNAIAISHTPNYDDICRRYPMTTLAASGSVVGQTDGQPGSVDLGHLIIGSGRVAQTVVSRMRNATASGDFLKNEVLNRAFSEAKSDDSSVHLIGLVSDADVHSSMENLFELLRLAKQFDLSKVFIHCILDGVDVPTRTADIYVEALEIKLADIGIGRIATMCGRFFAMDSADNWERTARAFTLLVHAEGERASDAAASIRGSFLRGISDEFIAPVVIEQETDVPVARVANGDLVVFFNHSPASMRQLVRSLCVPEGQSGTKPSINTVCLTEYDPAFDLPVAFPPEPERNTLTEVLAQSEITTVKITETSRINQLSTLFNGGISSEWPLEQHIFLPKLGFARREIGPESQSFKITDAFLRQIESTPHGFFVINLPAADMMAETGNIDRTTRAVQYIDTCIGSICEKVREVGGVAMFTSTHGNCEEIRSVESGEPNNRPTANPVPFHYIDDETAGVRLQEGRSLHDIAPTILGLLDIARPPEMTGTDLRCL